jgi:GTP-binding protein HflX
LSDTVGFISDLPTQLVAAFRATLEEVTAADVICHVRDMSNPSSDAQKKQVLQVLADLGVVGEQDEGTDIPILEVWNKLDLLSGDDRAEFEQAAATDEDAVAISALTGEGVDDFLSRVDAILTAGSREHEITLEVGEGKALAWLHQHGHVLSDEPVGDKGRRNLVVKLSDKEYGRFLSLQD